MQAVLDNLGKTPSEANHAFKYLRSFFLWCVRRDLLEANPIAAMRMPYREHSRDRILTPAELKAIWQVATDYPFGTIIRLAILTGQRRGELQYMTVTDGIATNPAAYTKNGREHVFPLGSHFILCERVRIDRPGCDGLTDDSEREHQENRSQHWQFPSLARLLVPPINCRNGSFAIFD